MGQIRNRLLLLALLGTPLLPRALGQTAPPALPPFVEGVRAYDAKDLPRAFEAFERAVKQNPHNKRAYHYLGRILLARGQPADAVAPLERARTLDPEVEELSYDLGRAYLGAGRLSDALASLDRAIAESPRRAILHLYRGQALLGLGRWEQAIRSFEQARGQSRLLAPEALLRIGLAHEKLDRQEAAVEAYRAAQTATGELAATASAEQVAAYARDRLQRLERPAPLAFSLDRLTVQARAAMVYDTNLALRPSGVPLPPDLPDDEDVGALLTLDLGYRLVESRPLTLDLSTGFLQTLYGEVRELDAQGYRAGLDVFTDAAHPLRFGLRYTFSAMWIGGSEFEQLHALNPYVFLGLGPAGAAGIHYSFRARTNYIPSPLRREDLDGTDHAAGALYRIEPLAWLALELGYTFERGLPDGLDLRYRGHRLTAALELGPVLGCRGTLRFGYAWLDFDHPSSRTGFLEARDDREASFEVALSRELARHVSVTASCLLADTHSDVRAFEYTRVRLTTGLAVSF